MASVQRKRFQNILLFDSLLYSFCLFLLLLSNIILQDTKTEGFNGMWTQIQKGNFTYEDILKYLI